MISIESVCRRFSAQSQREWQPGFSKTPAKWIRSSEDSKPDEWLVKQPQTQQFLPALTPVDEAIEKSRRLLELRENWDDEGARPISLATWDIATAFLRSEASAFHSRHSVSLPAPKLSPCADGSIDLLWRAKKLKLLVNVQPDNLESDFYGETTDGLKLKGTFRPGVHQFELLQDLFTKGLR